MQEHHIKISKLRQVLQNLKTIEYIDLFKHYKSKKKHFFINDKPNVKKKIPFIDS